MKKIIAIIALVSASLVYAGEYAVTKVIPITTAVAVTNVTSSATATAFVLERLIANIESTNGPSFVIVGTYRDVTGAVLQRKVIPVSFAQAIQMMPNLPDVMAAAQGSVEASIASLLAE